MDTIAATEFVTQELKEINDIVEARVKHVKHKEKTFRERVKAFEKLKHESYNELSNYADELFRDALLRIKQVADEQILKVQSILEQSELLVSICIKQKEELDSVSTSYKKSEASLKLYKKRLDAEQKRVRALQHKVSTLETQTNRLTSLLKSSLTVSAPKDLPGFQVSISDINPQIISEPNKSVTLHNKPQELKECQQSTKIVLHHDRQSCTNQCDKCIEFKKENYLIKNNNFTKQLKAINEINPLNQHLSSIITHPSASSSSSVIVSDQLTNNDPIYLPTRQHSSVPEELCDVSTKVSLQDDPIHQNQLRPQNTSNVPLSSIDAFKDCKTLSTHPPHADVQLFNEETQVQPCYLKHLNSQNLSYPASSLLPLFSHQADNNSYLYHCPTSKLHPTQNADSACSCSSSRAVQPLLLLDLPNTQYTLSTREESDSTVQQCSHCHSDMPCYCHTTQQNSETCHVSQHCCCIRQQSVCSFFKKAHQHQCLHPPVNHRVHPLIENGKEESVVKSKVPILESDIHPHRLMSVEPPIIDDTSDHLSFNITREDNYHVNESGDPIVVDPIDNKLPNQLHQQTHLFETISKDDSDSIHTVHSRLQQTQLRQQLERTVPESHKGKELLTERSSMSLPSTRFSQHDSVVKPSSFKNSPIYLNGVTHSLNKKTGYLPQPLLKRLVVGCPPTEDNEVSRHTLSFISNEVNKPVEEVSTSLQHVSPQRGVQSLAASLLECSYKKKFTSQPSSHLGKQFMDVRQPLKLLSPRRVSAASGVQLPLIESNRLVIESAGLLKELTRKIESKKPQHLHWFHSQLNSTTSPTTLISY